MIMVFIIIKYSTYNPISRSSASTMNVEAAERMQRKLRDRHELRRWFDPATGKYVVPRVKIRPRKSETKAKTRRRSLSSAGSNTARSRTGSHADVHLSLSAVTRSATGTSATRGEAPNGREGSARDTSRGKITKNGMLHTQRRMGKSKGKRDARVMHDAIIVAVSKIRKMRAEMESQALSVAQIRLETKREAIKMDGEISHEAGMDAGSWLQTSLDELRAEVKLRHGIYNKLRSDRARLEKEVHHLEKQVDNVASNAGVRGHETFAVVHKIDHDLQEVRKKLSAVEETSIAQQNYSRVLSHLKMRTKTEVVGAPVRQQFLVTSEKSIAAECRHMEALLEETLKQKDAEAEEVEMLRKCLLEAVSSLIDVCIVLLRVCVFCVCVCVLNFWAVCFFRSFL